VNPTDLTTERIAENQASFREANEKIEAAADNMELIARIPFICECADPNCMEIIHLSQDEYEAVRQHPARFFTAPGHAALSLAANAAVVAAELDGYTLVDKIGVAGEIAVERYDEPL
jgi:hypothetical protein